MTPAERKARSRALALGDLVAHLELATQEIEVVRRATARVLGGTEAGDSLQRALDFVQAARRAGPGS